MDQTAHSTQVFSVFGGYVPELRTDVPANLGRVNIDEAVTSPGPVMFSEILQSLRATLSVRRTA
jgi:hypothetical protein